MDLNNFVNFLPIAEHSNQQWQKFERDFIKAMLLGNVVLEIFRAYNFKFAFLHIVLRCCVKSSLLSTITPKSFTETPFLIAVLLYWKLSNLLGAPGVIKNTVRIQYNEVTEKPVI